MNKCVQNSLSEQVYTMLKRQILSGELAGGMKIPEEVLAEQFGVSRTPIREAIRRLNEYGLVTIKPRSYATVSIITPEEAKDIINVRVILEHLAVDYIDEEAYAKHVKEFSRHAADCQYSLGIGDKAAIYEQDSLFHLTMIRATNNTTLINISERLDPKVQQLRITQNLPEEELSYYLGQHAQIMSLLKNGEKEACKRLLHEHITHELQEGMA